MWPCQLEEDNNKRLTWSRHLEEIVELLEPLTERWALERNWECSDHRLRMEDLSVRPSMLKGCEPNLLLIHKLLPKLR
ncbi:hypothetical protein WUBG_14940 [Wuchereria bancrofti]|uniref:Uncharacterized protein n=1 Tax=Wuchereria bancrofti TaxID=6293 RepID=J9DWK6_WUCBA|nr:hypothetical protein WUBG_14940 [Wuchereria bancrofti]